ncbi:glycosyl hydrolase family 31 [Zalerion maritima]|uniref:alpha-glucosidase n=1 Tax=Zalerion maritima TaxID=339359 RepID=A0AAD5RTM1_9PEZI|nr:glycosyl hydrolase family 31 [Zalerion maritima]
MAIVEALQHAAVDIDQATFVLASASLFLLYGTVLITYRRFFHPISHIPGPWLATTRLYKYYYDGMLGGRFYHEMERLHKIYGPVLRIGPNEVHLCDPDNYDKIYSLTSKFTKDPQFYNIFGNPQSHFSNPNPAASRKQRAILSPFFSKRSASKQEALIQSKALKLCDLIDNETSRGCPVWISQAFRALSLDIVSEYSFGKDNGYNFLDDPSLGRWWSEMIQGLNHMMPFTQLFPALMGPMQAIPDWLSVRINPVLRDMVECRIAGRKMVDVIWKEMKSGSQSQNETIFHRLISAGENGELKGVEVTQQYLADEAFTILGAAGDTVGNALSIGLYHVIRNPEVYAELSKELRDRFSDEKDVSLPELEKLPYLTSVIKEALRTGYGVIKPLPRVTPPEGETFNGYYIPEGTTVGMSAWFLHRHPTAFPNPDEFDPDRWMVEQSEVHRLDRYMVPFSRGSRSCLAQNLALAELYVTFGRLFHRFDDMTTEARSEDMQYESYFSVFHPPKAKKLVGGFGRTEPSRGLPKLGLIPPARRDGACFATLRTSFQIQLHENDDSMLYAYQSHGDKSMASRNVEVDWWYGSMRTYTGEEYSRSLAVQMLRGSTTIGRSIGIIYPTFCLAPPIPNQTLHPHHQMAGSKPLEGKPTQTFPPPPDSDVTNKLGLGKGLGSRTGDGGSGDKTARLSSSRALFLTLFSLIALFVALFVSPRAGDSLSDIAAVMKQCILAGVPFLASALAAPTTSEEPSSTASETLTSAAPEQFQIPEDADKGQPVIPNVDDELAVDAQDVCPGYKAENVKGTDAGLKADLVLAGKECNVYGNDVKKLSLVVEYQAEDMIHVEIRPAEIKPEEEMWYILPEEIVPRPEADPEFKLHMKEGHAANTDMLFSWSNDPSFNFNITRKSNNDVLFETKGWHLVFENQFVELGTKMPENYNINGLPEVIHPFKISNNHTRTLYAADSANPIDQNSYGVHPFYLDTRYFRKTDDGEEYVANATKTDDDYVSKAHGVFYRNSHGHEIITKPENITWRTIGGEIDLYFLAGPTQPEVTRTYAEKIVGFPAMHPYWSLGFHQCRWGYEGWDDLRGVVSDFKKFGIPLETIWADIDYMKRYRNFNNDPENWSYDEARVFLSDLHNGHQHFIPIVDSAIYIPNPNNPEDAYDTYDRGIESDAFLMNPDGSLYIGAVWPGYTVFPDWVGGSLNGTKVFEWWAEELKLWYEQVNYDGIWIDMNEVSSFCVGSCGTGNLTLNPVHPPFTLPGEPGNEINDYPEDFGDSNSTEATALWASMSSAYEATHVEEPASTSDTSAEATSTGDGDGMLRTEATPGARNVNWPPYALKHVQADLASHAVSPNATSHGGFVQYDFHSLFGYQILNATYHALEAVFPNKRPFIIGRSTFAGAGKWAGHWGGDNFSLWTSMALSIPQMLTFQLGAVPMFGADACGFIGNTHAFLCARWMQLAAFTPFYRNHNIRGAIGQEPYRWDVTANATRNAMHVRYQILPYMYTLMHKAHAHGETVVRALAWEFPDEPWLAGADRQFMLGPNILVTPVLEPGYRNVSGVLPGVRGGDDDIGTIWYDWYSHAALEGVERGQNVTFDAPVSHIPVHLRGGRITPIQEPGMTVKECREGDWGLLVALDKRGSSVGVLYLDDGESIAPEAKTVVNFVAEEGTLVSVPAGNYVSALPLASVTIMGVHRHDVGGVRFNDDRLPKDSWSFDKAGKILEVKLRDATADAGAWSGKWTLSW